MAAGGLSRARLTRLSDTMARYVASGEFPGLVALVSRRGETHVDALGAMAFGDVAPMRRDAIFRIASMTKPVVAAAAMTLVEECRLRMDDPVDALLPELADRRVLRRPDSPLEDTVPAERAITLRDLLTFRLGIGAIMAPPRTLPIQAAMDAAGLAPGPDSSPLSPDEWMARLSDLPLVHQPGERWMYHTGSEVLGVLIARAAGQSLDALLQDRIFAPLAMQDTGFQVPGDKLDRLTTSYGRDPQTGEMKVVDPGGAASRYSRAPKFHSGGAGLVSTADDYLAFCQMLLDKGAGPRGRILSRPSVELMTTNHLTPEQKTGPGAFLGAGTGWGFGMSVITARDNLWASPGRFGWDGGRGTSAHADPTENMIGVLLTQRMMDSPQPPRAFVDFWTMAYQAIDD
jgi:CubicO group peptidase (beta-lactamase class C family)